MAACAIGLEIVCMRNEAATTSRQSEWWRNGCRCCLKKLVSSEVNPENFLWTIHSPVILCKPSISAVSMEPTMFDSHLRMDSTSQVCSIAKPKKRSHRWSQRPTIRKMSSNGRRRLQTTSSASPQLTEMCLTKLLTTPVDPLTSSALNKLRSNQLIPLNDTLKWRLAPVPCSVYQD